MTDPQFAPLTGFDALSPAEMTARAEAFYAQIRRRRTVRDFSPEPVPPSVIESCLLAAGTAPSGANMQPWHFVVIANSAIKTQIRQAAEAEEREFYQTRATPEWLAALAPLGTDDNKPFLETAPFLIAIFAKNYSIGPDGEKIKHYYVNESVGIATGVLITALHQAGLASLTHTPSPMGFLNDILHRPPNERPFLLLVVGRPADNATVPVISKKLLDEIATFL